MTVLIILLALYIIEYRAIFLGEECRNWIGKLAYIWYAVFIMNLQLPFLLHVFFLFLPLIGDVIHLIYTLTSKLLKGINEQR